MSDTAISVSKVSKCYRVFDDQRSRLLHAVWPNRAKGVQEIWALKDINFEIKRGESVAIIGKNGSGKSTLLEILTGTMIPTSGQVKINGRVSALLELGSGFNPEYTGRENVILNGLLLGLSKNEILSRFVEIEAFAEVGAAIDRPVKTYSSGMMMRLAFAVQVLCDPDILIIDEALSVGDFFFQQKCLGYIKTLCAKGVTLLFVSHDMGIVRDLCPRAVYINDGHLELDSEVNTVIRRYLSSGSLIGAEATHEVIQKSQLRGSQVCTATLWGVNVLWQQQKSRGLTQILAVGVEDKSGNQVLSARLGEVLRFNVWYSAEETLPVHVNIVLKNRSGQLVNCTSSYTLGLEMPASIEGRVASFGLEMEMHLEPGQYSLQISLALALPQKNNGHVLDQTPSLGPLTISWDYHESPPPFYGIVGLPVSGKALVLHEHNSR